MTVDMVKGLGFDPALGQEEGLGIDPAVVQEEGLGIDPAVVQEEGLGIEPAIDQEEGLGIDPAVVREGLGIEPAIDKEEGLGIDPAVVQEEGLGIGPAVVQEEGLGTGQIIDHALHMDQGASAVEEYFDFRKPDEWPRWLRRFEQYRVASGLSTEDEGKQVNTLLYCLGEEAGEVFAACDATDKAKKVYAEAVHTFEKFLGVRKNLIFERPRFNSRDQMKGESTEQYLLVLHGLARNCDYGQLREELIRDRIVIGILDKALSKRLQMDPELTLEKASRMVRQSESVREQQLVLKGQKDKDKEGVETDVNWMKSMNKGAHHNPSSFCTRRYAQIEKEALAITWACEKFSEYILGKQISIETDHKPLVPLLSSKRLDDLPPRVLRFRLRLMRFAFSIVHVPGKYMYTADALSRAPTGVPVDSCIEFQKEVESHIAAVTETLPATKQQLDKYRHAQATDTETGAVITYCKFGWPVKAKLSPNLKPYWMVRAKLTLHHDLLLYGSRIVIPQGLRQETMLKIHQGHQGILKCRLCVESAVWWPGVSNEVENFVKQCHTCSQRSTPPVEPMIASKLPDYPWQKVGADLFELEGIKYLLLVDYFSRYIEIVKLTSTTSGTIISVLKTVFS
eukprot:Em0001g238a